MAVLPYAAGNVVEFVVRNNYIFAGCTVNDRASRPRLIAGFPCGFNLNGFPCISIIVFLSFLIAEPGKGTSADLSVFHAHQF